jgi:hypothetical protein
MMCSYKELAELYWNSATDVNVATPDNQRDVQRIWAKAMTDCPADFGWQVTLGDPGEFYRWVVTQLAGLSLRKVLHPARKRRPDGTRNTMPCLTPIFIRSFSVEYVVGEHRTTRI